MKLKNRDQVSVNEIKQKDKGKAPTRVYLDQRDMRSEELQF